MNKLIVLGIVVKTKHLQTKLDRTLEKMAERDLDTSTAESLVEGFSGLLDEAQTDYESALKEFGNKQIQEGQEKVKKAQEKLKEANNKLKDIIKEIKEQGGDKDLKENKI